MPEISQSNRVDSLKSLRKLISEPPSMMKKRLQSNVDGYCQTIIQNAAVCALGFADPAADIEFLNLRDAPVVRAEADRIALRWPAGKALPPVLAQGAMPRCSLYFIMPGIGFALRANGRCAVVQQEGAMLLEFQADALFLHCSRAKVRAGFWRAREEQGEASSSGAAGLATLSEEALAFIARSPYVLMLTRNADGATELSPRGDPDGFVLARDRNTLVIPERPGNKVACTLTNILAQDQVTVSFLIPGSATVLSVAGRGWLSADRQTLEALAVNGKVPTIGIVVHVDRYRFQHCPELVNAGLWVKETHLRESDIPSFPKMLAEHMNGKGLLGKATTLVVDAVVKHDLKNLY
jgi:predicted pyridoxine 5'-phosphate oxidase superfamily flavin-nucleotide-binding protein